MIPSLVGLGVCVRQAGANMLRQEKAELGGQPVEPSAQEGTVITEVQPTVLSSDSCTGSSRVTSHTSKAELTWVHHWKNSHVYARNSIETARKK